MQSRQIIDLDLVLVDADGHSAPRGGLPFVQLPSRPHEPGTPACWASDPLVCVRYSDEGLVFRRSIIVDAGYLYTLKREGKKLWVDATFIAHRDGEAARILGWFGEGPVFDRNDAAGLAEARRRGIAPLVWADADLHDPFYVMDAMRRPAACEACDLAYDESGVCPNCGRQASPEGVAPGAAAGGWINVRTRATPQRRNRQAIRINQGRDPLTGEPRRERGEGGGDSGKHKKDRDDDGGGSGAGSWPGRSTEPGFYDPSNHEYD